MRQLKIFPGNKSALVPLQRAHVTYIERVIEILTNHDQGNEDNFLLALHVLKSCDIEDGRIVKALKVHSIRTFNHWRKFPNLSGQERIAAIKAIIGLLEDELHRLQHQIANIVAPDK